MYRLKIKLLNFIILKLSGERTVVINADISKKRGLSVGANALVVNVNIAGLDCGVTAI